MRHSPNQTDARANRPRELPPRERVKQDAELRRQVRDAFATLDVPGTPSVRNARFIQGMGIPDWCGTRQVHDVRIQEGDPVHGAKRSDAHIKWFEIEVPFEEIDWTEVRGKRDELFGERNYIDVCHDCGCQRAFYEYSASHFISGYERVYCPDCETEYAREDWG